jgi:alpha-ribazole phosphatase
MSKTTRFWLIRHAPPINPEGVIYGARDIPVDTSDETSFAGLASTLPYKAAWVATPLKRTHETAAAIRRAWTGNGGPPESVPIVPGLIEQDFGEWQGLTHAEVHARWPQFVSRFWLAPAHETPPGGESFARVVERVGAALEELGAAHKGGDVVVVSHGGPIRAALAVALGIDPERALAFRIDTLSLTRLDRIAGDPVAWRVAGVNLPPGTSLPE